MPTGVVAFEPLVSVTDFVRGVSVHARVSARSSGLNALTLVFVHGLGVSVRYLEPTMALLADRYPVAGLDFPGFGRSGSPPGVLGVRALADVLGAWLDARAIGPAILFGNSFGCQIIVDLVAREPARARGLMLNAPTMDPAHRTVLGQVARVLADVPNEPWRLGFVVARDYFRAGPRRLFTTLRHALADRIEEKLPFVPVPVVVVCGAHDPVVSAEWAAEVARVTGSAVAGAAGAALTVVSSAGHALPYDEPAVCAALIESVAEQVRGRGERSA